MSKSLKWDLTKDGRRICHEVGHIAVTNLDTQDSDIKIKLKNRWGWTRAKATRSLADLVASQGQQRLHFDEVRGGMSNGSYVMVDVQPIGVDTTTPPLPVSPTPESRKD